MYMHCYRNLAKKMIKYGWSVVISLRMDIKFTQQTGKTEGEED